MKKMCILPLLLALASAPGLSTAQTPPDSGDIFGLINLRDMDAIATQLRDNKEDVLAARAAGGITPLHYAAKLNVTEAVYRLLDAGVDVDILTEGSLTTPLHWAANDGASDTLRLLLKMGADVDAKAKNGYTALHFLSRGNNDPEIAQYLLDAGADINATDARGDTPLHLAAANGHPKMVAFFLNANAATAVKNRDGKQAFEIAKDAATRLAFGETESPMRAAPRTPKTVQTPPSPAPVPVPVLLTPSSEVTPDEPTVEGEAHADTDTNAHDLLAIGEEYRRFMNDPDAIQNLDGSVYKGGVRNGEYHGYGIHCKANRERYQGEWRQGVRHGIGTFTYSTGDVYTGQWQNNVPHGDGAFSFANGGSITGVWRNGSIVEASGTFVGKDGTRYSGTWRNHTLESYSPVR